MGLKFLYYIDTSANWTLFTLGIICVPFGIGGMLLTTPVKHKNVSPPWYHATGIWVGMVFLCIAMMMPFARFNPTFLRLAVLITFLAMIVAAVGLGVGIDEFTNWFENPTVKTFGSDALSADGNIFVSESAKLVVKNFEVFDMFHKTRVIMVMIGTLLGVCMLLFRIVTLGLVIFDEFTTRGYDVFTPEEEMMYQAMAEREMGLGEDGEKADYEAGYQPILYAGTKMGRKVTDLPMLNEKDGDEESYEEKMKGIRDIVEQSSTIYDLNVFVERRTSVKESLPTYTDAQGNLLSDLRETDLVSSRMGGPEYRLFEKEASEDYELGRQVVVVKEEIEDAAEEMESNEAPPLINM